MEKKKVQANTEDVIKALSSYLENLILQDGCLRVDNKRLVLPINRLKSLGLWDANKMVLEYLKIQRKNSNQSADIRHWIEALVIHAIQIAEKKEKETAKEDTKQE